MKRDTFFFDDAYDAKLQLVPEFGDELLERIVFVLRFIE